MKIAVTSPSFSNNQLLRRELLAIFPDSIFNDSGEKLMGARLVDFLQGVEGAIIGLEQIDESLLSQLPSLRFVAKYGVGLDNIDLEACQRHHVQIGSRCGVNRISVAEMTIGFMIGLCRNLFFSSYELRRGHWKKAGGQELSQLCVGIVGVGHIGKEVIRMLEPFHCRILVNDIIDQRDYYKKNGLFETTKEELFRTADVISIHTPLTPETEGLIQESTLKLMKPTAFLINTARGRIIHQRDLREALKKGIIAGAAIDVYEDEPVTDRELIELPNIICTPHIGGNSKNAVIAMGRCAIERLRELSQS
ncbi:MAG TPA: phosphoglycerate dehydrogenase [Candidatus Ozemobacteraceae bacterium]